MKSALRKKSLFFNSSLVIVIVLSVLILDLSNLYAQKRIIGKGSYTVELPAGESSASDEDGNAILPNVDGAFNVPNWSSRNRPVITNKFWSNILFLHQTDIESDPVYAFAHPFQFDVTTSGLTLGHAPVSKDLSDRYYTYFTDGELNVGLEGVTTEFKATNYSDWTATTTWETDSTSLEATFGHGLPFVFFKSNGAKISLTSDDESTFWHQGGHVLGITIDSKHYGIFGPTGSSWSSDFPLVSSLNDQGFLSIALLPDTSMTTFNFFKNHAYAFVEDTKADWNYDSQTNEVTVTYNVTTKLMEESESYVNETLQALYRHHWINTSDPLTSYTYNSPRGTMKVLEGNSFTTNNTFIGILPSLPDLGDYDRSLLLDYVNQEVGIPLPSNKDTYNSGKAMGKLAQLIHIADQLGDLSAKSKLLDELKIGLENWFTAGGDQQYYFDENWQVLIGFPSSHGANTSLNDQHFHHGYAIYAAATVAQYDSAWATQDNWGGMVNLLIRNASNWERAKRTYPYMRNFDIYAGHSWAAGHSQFRRGNNQESSSEAMNHAIGIFLWGEITGQDDIRDLGAYLYTIEAEAVYQYWFDVDNEVFPENFAHDALGMVWGSGGYHGTWFSSDIEKIRGINFLPISSGSMYLGKYPEYVMQNFNKIVETKGGHTYDWEDRVWKYLALSDADLAISHYKNKPDYSISNGESKAQTMHWLYNMNKLGQVNTEVQANIPTYNVFVNSDGDTSYVAYNSDPNTKKVTFSNGFSFDVPGKETKVFNRSMPADTIGRPETTPDFNFLKVISIFSEEYETATNIQLALDSTSTTEANFKSIDGNNVIVLENLDSQRIEFESKLDLSTRTNLYFNVWSEIASDLKFTLLQDDNSSKQVTICCLYSNSWRDFQFPLLTFGEDIDLSQIDGIIVEGKATIVLDDILFYGDDPVKDGPDSSAVLEERQAKNVISVFSDKFTDLENTDFTPDLGQTTEASFFYMEGTEEEDVLLKLKNLDFHHLVLESPIDITNMDGVFFNYWTQESEALNFSLISSNGEEKASSISVRKNSWQYADISLDLFSGVSLESIKELKFDGDATIFIDNLFFYKFPEVTAAPVPTHDPAYVLSLYSDTYDNYKEVYPEYSNMKETDFTRSWDQASLTEVEIDGNNTLYYENRGYAIVGFFRGVGHEGRVDDGIDGTKLTNLRLDFYTPDEVTLPNRMQIRLVDFGGDAYGGGNDTEDEYWLDENSEPKLVRNKWISLDIPLDDLPKMTGRANLSQLVWDVKGALENHYIDNIYFYSDQVLNSNENNDLEIPNKLTLHQNYPNPFNPNTNLQFDLPVSGYSVLKIYNSVGQLVQTLVDKNLQAGRHNYSFNGSQLASGVYFYRLEFGGNIITNKMILMK